MALNALGRVILTGPRGGEYVLDASGRKIRKFKRAPVASPAPAVAAPPAAAASPKNTLGRKIYTGSRGGRYVLDASGKKVRKFKEAPPARKGKNMKTPPPVVPSPPKKSLSGVSTKVTNKLHSILKNIRTRRDYKFPVSKRMNLSFNYIKYNSTGEMKRKPTKRSVRLTVHDFPLTNRRLVLAMHSTNFHQQWFKEQSDYVNSLNDYDYMTASAYTVQSHSWIGPYLLRGTVGRPVIHIGDMITPLFPQFVMTSIIRLKRLSGPYITIMRDAKTTLTDKYNAFLSYLPSMPNDVLEMCLKKYKNDLKRIIDGAPPVKKTMYLYRGTTNNIFKGVKGQIHTMKGFSSTAFNMSHALAYSSYVGGIIRIAVRPGSRVLLVAGLNQWYNHGEYEVILNIGSRFYISKRDVKRVMPTRVIKQITDVSIYS
jgi:hypothetical protein